MTKAAAPMMGGSSWPPAEVLARLQNPDDPAYSGLFNVRKRLRAIYGDQCSFTIDNSPMSEYESRLGGQSFCRIHKTCLVQLKYIQDIFPWNNSSFALRVRGSSSPLPIGRDRVKELRRRLNI